MKHRCCYQFGPFRLDPSARALERDGQRVPITGKVFDALVILVENHGRVVEKDELLSALWPDTIVEESNLAQNISSLRKILGETGRDRSYIATASGRGYSFVAEVIESTPDGAVPAVPGPEPAQSVTLRALAWPLALIVLAGSAVFLVSGRAGSGSMDQPFRVMSFTDDPGTETMPAFSPDGNRLAYVWQRAKEEQGDIYIKVVGAGSAVRLTSSPGWHLFPAWSPDGRFIAFFRAGGIRNGLYLIPALGGSERQIVSLDGNECGSGKIAWSADGTHVFASFGFGGKQSRIFSMAVASGDRTPITSPRSSDIGDYDPSISPDGRSLAFLRTSAASVADLYVVQVSGGEPRRLTFDGMRISGYTWSNDGQEILAFSDRGGISGLWRVPVSRSWISPQTPRLALRGDDLELPALSKAGYLAYAQVSANINVWRLDLAASASERKLRPALHSTGMQSDASFAPDGKHVAYWTRRSGSTEIWISDDSGNSPMQLTSFEGPHTGSPRFSPDGSKIAFDSRPGGNPDIFVMSADGGTPRRLTSEPSEDVVPSWSRDGRWIYFASNRGGSWQVWKMPSSGGKAIQVTRGGGFAGQESFDGQSVYYAKSRDNGGLWRVPVNGGKEEPVISGLRNWGWWALAQKGIYFIEQQSKQEQCTLKFLTFASADTQEIAVLPKAPIGMTPGMALSPDGRWLLLTQMDNVESDIKLVENFR